MEMMMITIKSVLPSRQGQILVILGGTDISMCILTACAIWDIFLGWLIKSDQEWSRKIKGIDGCWNLATSLAENEFRLCTVLEKKTLKLYWLEYLIIVLLAIEGMLCFLVQGFHIWVESSVRTYITRWLVSAGINDNEMTNLYTNAALIMLRGLGR